MESNDLGSRHLLRTGAILSTKFRLLNGDIQRPDRVLIEPQSICVRNMLCNSLLICVVANPIKVEMHVLTHAVTFGAFTAHVGPVNTQGLVEIGGQQVCHTRLAVKGTAVHAVVACRGPGRRG